MITGIRSRVFLLICALFGTVLGNWNEWWTYDGISGPAYWGLINPAWTMCNKGRRQSPINISPSSLTYDPGLAPLNIDKQLVAGKLKNTGQSLVFILDNGQVGVNMTGGPLQYQYQAEQLFLHWGREGSSSVGGSEHSVNHQSWPGEIQIYGYNSQLYSNLTQAQEMPGGVVAVSVMLQVKGETPDADVSSSGLHRIVSKLSQVRYRGDYARIHQMSLSSIMPNTADYITYEGSTTYPGCWESVTWIVMNKPVYISKQEMEMFHMLRQGDSPMMEKAPLGNNLRPRQPVNSRAVRTNIALHKQKDLDSCTEDLPKIVYTANDWIHNINTNTNV